MREARSGRGAASLLLVALLSGCGDPPRRDGGGEVDPPPRPKKPLGPPEEVVKACATHLEILHRIRLARELGPELAKLAGPMPSPEEFSQSLERVRDVGIDGTDDELSRAGKFAKRAQPGAKSAGFTFVAWTTQVDDVGLARIKTERRAGAFKELFGKAMSYEVLVLDGFRVKDYPSLREAALEHQEGPAKTPRRRGSLLVIDAAAIASAAQAIKTDARRERAEIRTSVEHMSQDDLVREVELREACYLRFQDEVSQPEKLDRVVTWLEILEGDPLLAYADESPCAGDRADERRRALALPGMALGPGHDDKDSEMLAVMKLPREERAKKLKELAPRLVRAELAGR